ncbi:hypothetical protein SAMN06265174_101783 [Dietzia kunjamensis subsp. schimae]|uniref:DUF2255 family protein n=1 Tax=Dietzia kunjamensis subsp. schimae TaxID=498198 RepID=A0ABY1MZ14_9ACTN|nr:DUF2255 family protein [Dietzia kunjamensis]MBB1015801.1 DUF2255 family protein [Dietzia kunjamensis subsp. schimae]SMO47227.1 hypothetical protein SAMN06265174_101783 [Dietzia kunjamensis subsp. schimae]
MTWSKQQLALIDEEPSFYVAPFRDDGTTYGTDTETWALVVDGAVYVRAASGPASRWYQAAITQKAGRVRVADQYFNVTFENSGTDYEAEIDAAYQTKYGSHEESFAVPIMQGAGPKAAAVRITVR